MTKPLELAVRQGLLAAAAFATLAFGGAAPSQAQTTLIPGVTGCDAPGGQQTGGALIGALVGGALGNGMSHHNRGAGTAIGAVLGAGLGAYVGCQRQEARAQAYGEPAAYGYVRPAYARPYAERDYADRDYAERAYAPAPVYVEDRYAPPRPVYVDDRRAPPPAYIDEDDAPPVRYTRAPYARVRYDGDMAYPQPREYRRDCPPRY